MSTADTDTSPQDAENQKLNLEVDIQTTSACERHVVVRVSREDVDRYLSDAFKELAPKAEVPGFRPGRAPRKLVESRFRDQVANQVKGSLLMDSLTQISDDFDFSPISEPDFDFDAVDLPDEGSMTFEFDIEVRPEFDLPQWKGLALERLTRTFSAEEVEAETERLLRRFGKPVERKDGAESDEDRMTLQLSVSHEGEPLITREELTAPIKGPLSFHDGTIENFAELVKDAKVGDKLKTQVTISAESSNEALQGKTVDVELEVTEIRGIRIPDLTPAFLDELGEFESVEDMHEAVRREMTSQHVFRQNQRIREQITQKLLVDADWDLPPALLKRQAQRELERSMMELRSSGFDDDFIRAYINRLRQNSLQSTAKALKEHFILERLAEENEIDAEPQDYEFEIQKIALQSNESARRVRARLEKRGQMDTLRNQIIENKVLELIEENADITEVPFEQPEKDNTFAVDFSLAPAAEGNIPEAKHAGDAEEMRLPTDRS